MIFLNNKSKIRALESEVQDLKTRVFALEQNTKYYTDKEPRFYTQRCEPIPLNDVVKAIAKHLKMNINITEPIDSRIETEFGARDFV